MKKLNFNLPLAVNSAESRLRTPIKFYRFDQVIVPLLILINLAIALTFSICLNIWLDEAYSLATTAKDLGYAFHQAIHFEYQLPLYFVVLNLWRKLNDSIIFARLFSVLCIALTLYLIPQLTRRFIADLHPGWLIAYVMLNPYMLWAASEIRLYAFVMLLSTLLLLFFFDGYLSENSSQKARIGYVLISIISLYTSYFLAFSMIANALALVVLKRWKPLLNYGLGMVLAGLSFVPLVPFLLKQSSSISSTVGSGTVMESLMGLVSTFGEYNLPIRYIYLPETRFFVVVFFLVGLAILVKAQYRWVTPQKAAIWVITIGVMALLAALFILTQAHLAPRYLIILFIPHVFAIFAAFSLLKKFPRKFVILLFTLVILSTNALYLATYYGPMAKTGDYARIAAHIMSAEKADQPILVFNAQAALPLAHYYAGRNALVPLPQAVNLETFDLRQFALKSDQQIISALAQVPGQHEYVWLVQAQFCGFGGIDYDCPRLERFVNRYYSVEASRDFFDATVRLLHRKPNTVFEKVD